MSIKRTLNILYILIIVGILSCSWILNNTDDKKDVVVASVAPVESLPVSLKTYYLVEENCERYNIPKHIIYNVLYRETRYHGPFDWNYDPYQTSSQGAQGPMQIMTQYSHGFSDEIVTPYKLRTDIELNITIGCKMLQRLFGIYKSWDIALGFYGTGKPIANAYSKYSVNNYDYQKNWVKIDCD